MRMLCLAIGMVLLAIVSTAQTFTLFKDINPGIANSDASIMGSFNGKLYIAANDGTNGRELWVSDGTPTGTQLLKDINPGASGSSPSGFVVMNNMIYFKADDGVHGEELWKTDGTLVGTEMVRDINPGANGSLIQESFAINNILYLAADDGVNGIELWKTDGTEANTVMVKNINTNVSGGFPGKNSTPSSFTELNGLVYFAAINAVGDAGLWKSDGTDAGTVLIRNGIGVLRKINNTLVFTPSGTSALLWKSDGTTAGTSQIKATGGTIWVMTNDNGSGTGFFYTTQVGSFSIWKTDGTEDGTVKVKDIPTPASVSYFIGNFAISNDKLFFVGPVAPDGASELWISDATTAGTVLVKDILPGPATSQPQRLTSINGTLYFSANDGINGIEIWKSDGTAAGTLLVQDIANPGNSTPSGFFLFNSKLFVSVTDNADGRELWVSTLGSTLPLTLLDVRGRLLGSDGLLNWTTASEDKMAYFEIERSIDNRHYTVIGSKPASNTAVTHEYSFTDAAITSIGAEVVYYRLKAKDLDGKYTYSKTIAINIRSKQPVIMFYPNPVKQSATLMIAVQRKEKLNCSIIDQQGRVVRKEVIVVIEGSNLVNIETSALSPGPYTIIIAGATTNTLLKFIKSGGGL
jgi:trimeric autotransporter adhesin